MRIIFGTSFDGGCYPSVLDRHEASAGIAHLGPAGLLAVLEQAQGIPAASPQQPLRVAEYATRLAQHDDGSRFYSASRAADPWRVSRKLLSLRDELILAGWKREIPNGDSRLRVFADLEDATRNSPVSPGLPERLLTVLSRLEFLPARIDRIDLLDDTGCLPKLWRDLFQKLSAAGTQISRLAESFAASQGDLGSAQRSLRGKTATAACGDGSLLRLESTGVMEAAEVTCAYLRSLLKKAPPESIVIIRDGDPRAALVLEAALRAFDIPSAGLSLDSSHRPATQILPLFLGLSWQPVDPDLLVEFLTLPSSPIPAAARRRLRESLNEAPGYRSHAWKEAREKSIEEIRSKYGDDRAAEADREIKKWLDDVKRTPLRSEMAVSAAVRLIAQVESWANRRAFADEKTDPFFFQAKEQAALMQRLVEIHPRSTISKSEIDRLLLDVLQTGMRHELSYKEVDSVQVISDPAAIFGEARTVIWWQCVASSAAVPAPLFWNQEELEFLQRSGCVLPSPMELLIDYARSWRRPVLCAKESLLLVQPRQTFGEPEESHPIWNEISAGVAADEATAAKISISAAGLINGTAATLVKPPEITKAKKVSLPSRREFWQLPAAHLTPLPTTSPTSLQAALACPFQWVLQNKARLEEPLIQVLLERQLLYGNFAHWLVGEYLRLFIGSTLPKSELAAAEIGRRFDAVVESEAAPLAKPGFDREKIYVRETLVGAVGSLIRLLQAGGYRIASIEETHERDFLLGKLRGRTDLTVQRVKDGVMAVIDLKWSSEGPKIDALKNGCAFQLAAYSFLMRKKTGWPPTAYFLFPTGQLYSTSPDDFPGCIPVTGPAEGEVWEAAMKLTQEAKAKLDAGVVEVPGAGQTNGSSRGKQSNGIMELDPPCKYCGFELFCGQP